MEQFSEEFNVNEEEKYRLLTRFGYIPKELYEEALNELKKKDDELKKKDDELNALRKFIKNAGLTITT
jgi:Zn-dependent peptidase ImmA (M78 family)